MSLYQLKTSREFCQHIIDELVVGYGIIPFIGSGLSRQSGILTGQDFTNFLSYSIYQSIESRLNIGVEGWPRIPNQSDMKVVKKWFLRNYRRTAKSVGMISMPDNGEHVEWFRSSNSQNQLSSLLGSIKRPPVPELIRSKSALELDQHLLQLMRTWKIQPSLLTPHNRFSKNSKEYVTEFAMRSCYDWRASLDLLARIEHLSDNDGMAIRDVPDTSIFDSFNVHITRDRQPNLGHKMIAHLSRVLRSRLILTTNFDPLLEESFARISRPLKEFSVSTQGGLPSEQIVFSSDCIIKLHGSLMETRADFSLDSPPTSDDLSRFASYITGKCTMPKDGKKFRSNHLLAIGYSATDFRCVQMLKHLLDHSNDTIIFWVCFSSNDRERLEQTFSETKYQNRIRYHINSQPDLLLYELYQRTCIGLPSGGVSYQYTARRPAWPRNLSIAQKKEASLLEKVNNIETVGGPKIKSIIPKTSEQRNFVSQRLAEFILETVQKNKVPNKANQFYRNHFDIKQVCFEGDRLHAPISKLNPITMVHYNSGSISAVAKLIELCQSKGGKRTFFFELQDYPSVRGLLREVLVSLSLQTGSFQTELVNFLPRHSEFFDLLSSKSDSLSKHLKQLFQQINITPEEFVLCFYARNGYGTCSSWGNNHGLWKNPKTDFNSEKSGPSKKSDVSFLWKCLQLMSKLGFKIVYFPLEKTRVKLEITKLKRVTELAKCIQNEINPKKTSPNAICQIQKPSSFEKNFRSTSKLKDHISYDLLVDSENFCWQRQSKPRSRFFEKRMKYVESHFITPYLEDLESNNANSTYTTFKLLFLYAATLIRQSRHASALFSEAVLTAPQAFNLEGIDNDLLRSQWSQKWIKKLYNNGVLHEKSGGFYWMHRDLRIGIQRLIEHLTFPCKPKRRSFPQFIQKRSSLHRLIGDWYRRAFLTNAHWIPATECMYHFRMAALHAKYSSPGYENGAAPSKQERENHRFQILHASLVELIKIIERAKGSLRFWLADSKGFAMLRDHKKVVMEIEFHSEDTDQIELIEQIKNRLKIQLGELKHLIRNERDVSMPQRIHFNRYYVLGSETPAGEPKKRASMGKLTIPIGDIQSIDPKWFRSSTTESGDWNKVLVSLDAEKWIFNAFEKSMNMKTDSDRKSYVEYTRKNRIRWIAEYGKEPEKVLAFTQALSEFAYEHLRRANLENDLLSIYNDLTQTKDYSYLELQKILQEENKQNLAKIRRYLMKRRRIKKLRLAVTNYSFIGLTLCHHLDPLYKQEETILRAKFHTFHGLCLAHLNRFYEAIKHTTEAQQNLTGEVSGNIFKLEHAVIRLRRAECYITRAKYLLKPRKKRKKNSRKCRYLGNFKDSVNSISLRTGEPSKSKIKNSEHLMRSICASIDDAACTLELVERQLAGISQHSLWWGRFYTLKTELYFLDAQFSAKFGEKSNRTYLQRSPKDHSFGAVEIRNKGLLATEHSPTRQLRILRHFANYCEYSVEKKKKNKFEMIEKIENLASKIDNPKENAFTHIIQQLLLKKVQDWKV